MSASRGFSSCAGRCTSVVSTPISAKFSAASMPMKPPPTTTARRGVFSVTNVRRARASSTVRKVNTRGESSDTAAGTTGAAPGAKMSLS